MLLKRACGRRSPSGATDAPRGLMRWNCSGVGLANGQRYRHAGGEWPTELATMKGEQMLKAMLYDTDLGWSCCRWSRLPPRQPRDRTLAQRHRSGAQGQSDRLQHTSDQLGGIHYCVGKASDQLQELHDQLMGR